MLFSLQFGVAFGICVADTTFYRDNVSTKAAKVPRTGNGSVRAFVRSHSGIFALKAEDAPRRYQAFQQNHRLGRNPWKNKQKSVFTTANPYLCFIVS